MACRKCGSTWTTIHGADMASCPICCKQQLCKARKQGRVPPVPSRCEKQCQDCGCSFAVIGQRSVVRATRCQECVKSKRRAYGKKEGSARRRLSSMLARFVGEASAAMLAREAASLACARFLISPPRQCKSCGQPFVSDRRRNSPFCSFACCRAWSRDLKCVNCSKPVTIKAMGRSAISRKASPLCRSCVTRKWKKETPSGRAQSGKCDHRKRCRKFGVQYDPSVKPHLVFERDGYRCHVCKKATLPRFAWVHGKPDGRSPTIDHFPYPLSAGICGHEWHNVRCCCWSCNTRKGARWDGQLPLRMTRAAAQKQGMTA